MERAADPGVTIRYPQSRAAATQGWRPSRLQGTGCPVSHGAGPQGLTLRFPRPFRYSQPRRSPDGDEVIAGRDGRL
jgi:hypothetical protein